MSDSLWPHGLQHIWLPCPSLSPRVSSDSCSLSQWCHPTISSSVIPFSSCPQPFPASGSFPMSWLFASGGQSRIVVNFPIVPVYTFLWDSEVLQGAGGLPLCHELWQRALAVWSWLPAWKENAGSPVKQLLGPRHLHQKKISKNFKVVTAEL